MCVLCVARSLSHCVLLIPGPPPCTPSAALSRYRPSKVQPHQCVTPEIHSSEDSPNPLSPACLAPSSAHTAQSVKPSQIPPSAQSSTTHNYCTPRHRILSSCILPTLPHPRWPITKAARAQHPHTLELPICSHSSSHASLIQLSPFSLYYSLPLIPLFATTPSQLPHHPADRHQETVRSLS